jgi:hypothetical protein
VGQTLYLDNNDRKYFLNAVDVGQTLYLNNFIRTYCLILFDNFTSFIGKVTNKIDEIHILLLITTYNLTY